VVLQILIPTRYNLFAPAAPRLPTSLWRQTRCVRRRRAARTSAPSGRQLRRLLVEHWWSVALRVRPEPLPAPEPRERASVGCRGLLNQCESLLRVLCRHRLRVLGLRQSNVVDIAHRFDMRRFASIGSADALAYVMALMHWRGCSNPAFLLRPPLHPSTGVVRWHSTFSVVDQVDNGQLLLEQLALEEARVFAHALAIVRTMQRIGSGRSPAAALLLPELLTVSDNQCGSRMPQWDTITTRWRSKIKGLAAPET